MERNPPLKQNFLKNLPDEIIKDIQSYLYNLIKIDKAFI